MRRLVPSLFIAPALSITIAACSTVPKPAAIPVSTSPAPRPTAELIGMSVHDLGLRFGQPRFQVQEGPGTKLQWTRGGCVLDAYLYPPVSGPGAVRVTYADARRPSGADLDLRACLALMER